MAMSGRERTTEAQSDAGPVLPSLGLLSLNDAPVAARASGLAHELVLKGEDDGWQCIDEDDVGMQNPKQKLRDGSFVLLWEGSVETKDGKTKTWDHSNVKDFNWPDVQTYLADKLINGPWGAFYDKRTYDWTTGDGTWLGWSNFTVSDEKDKAGAIRNAGAHKFHKTAHYMALEDNPRVKAGNKMMGSIINHEPGGYSPYRKGYPGDSTGDLLAACEPLFNWIRTHKDAKVALKSDMDEDEKKMWVADFYQRNPKPFLEANQTPKDDKDDNMTFEKMWVADFYKRNIKTFLEAKQAHKDGNMKDSDFEAARFAAETGYYMITQTAYEKNTWEQHPPFPPGCMGHARLRFRDYKQVVGEREGVHENMFLGPTYDDWKEQVDNEKNEGPRPEVYTFYSCKTMTKAWFVFLGIAPTGDSLDTSAQLKAKRPRLDEAINKQRLQLMERRKAKQDEMNEANKRRKLQAEAEKAESAAKNKELQEENDGVLHRMQEDTTPPPYVSTVTEKELDAWKKDPDNADDLEAMDGDREQILRFIEKMRKNGPFPP